MPDFFDRRGEIEKTLHNLTHWQQGEVWVFVTWRLADSVPQDKLRAWTSQREAWLAHHPKPWDSGTEAEHLVRFVEPFDQWLDLGAGSCLLRNPENRQIVEDALLFFDGERYDLADFVIMPNHAHVLFRALGDDHTLPKILQSWKRHSARQINQRENRTGEALWQPDYFDRLIRSADHFRYVADYIRKNPRNLKPDDFTLYAPTAES